MDTYLNHTFAHETLDLDDNAFRGCVFEDCTLRFSGQGATELNGCTFLRSRLEAAGPAQMTLNYLRGFYQGLGEWGRLTVDALVDAIRQPAAPALDPGGAKAGSTDMLAGAYRAALEAFGATPEGSAIVRGFERLSTEQRKRIAELIGHAATARRAA
jgi:hypothetical protein